MRAVATLCIKQYGEYQLSAKKASRVSFKNRNYILEFAGKFENLKTPNKRLGRNPFVKKSEAKTRWTIPLIEITPYSIH
jgi:hypothetical protein